MEALEAAGADGSNDFFNLPGEAALLEEPAEGVGGEGEARGHVDAELGGCPCELPEGGVLPTHAGDVGKGKLLKPAYSSRTGKGGGGS